MTSRRRINRQWLRWSRWLDRCCEFGNEIAVTSGYERAYNRWASAYNGRKQSTNGRQLPARC